MKLTSANPYARLVLAIVISSIVALILAWVFAPLLAEALAKQMGYDTTQTEMPKILLLMDIVLSTLFFFIGSLLSIKIAKTKPYLAALGVSFVGWLVYFIEVRGLEGMLHSEYPLWYEFFPSHLGSGWVAASLVTANELPNTSSNITDNNSNEENLQNIPTPFFAVSTQKLIVMSLVTFNTYQVYWFYKNWKIIKARDASNISPVWRSVFGYFFCYPCFSLIRKFGQENSISGSIDAGLLAIGWIVAILLSKLPAGYFFLSSLSILFLVPVQQYVNKINTEIAPTHNRNSSYSTGNMVAIAIGGILILATILGLILKK
ncbi:MAG TPA: hypothetical protein VGJ90_01325 [Methylophilaceae bacterium]|jgi:hypothetical protein